MVHLFNALRDFGDCRENPFACDVRFDWNVRRKVFSVRGNQRERQLRSEWIKLGRHLHAVRGAGFDPKILQIRIQIPAKRGDCGGVRLLDCIARRQTAASLTKQRMFLSRQRARDWPELD